MSRIRFHGYSFEHVYQKLTKDLRNEIIVFWLENNALTIVEATQRVHQVAVVVRDSAENVVGVSTVFPAPYGPDGELYLNFRMFIHPAHRVAMMMREVTTATRSFFNSDCAARGATRGMVIFTENPKLMRPGVRRLFERSLWEYAGKDARGIDVWRFNFTS